MGNKLNLTGQRFGRWVVLREAENYPHGRSRWVCKCDCGTIRDVLSDSLRGGKSISCSCAQKEIAANCQRTHGMQATAIYKAWQNMKSRCQNPRVTNYKDYGGRGIKVCDKWQTFEGFYEDMGGTHEEGLTLDRTEVSGDYCKGNCRWATVEVQANNKRSNKIFTYNGVTDTLKRICKINKVKYNLVLLRLRKGLDIKSAIELPLQEGKKLKNITESA